MKEQVFTTSNKRILNQTYFIWLWVLTHIIFNIWFIILAISDGKWGALLIGNLFLGLFSIPAIIIFCKYYKHSINKRFIITYNTLKLEDEKTLKTIEMKNDEVVEVKFITNSFSSNLPWTFIEYFSLTDKNGNEIIVTSFIMEISDFWLSTLTRKVSNKNFIRKKVLYPTFRISK